MTRGLLYLPLVCLWMGPPLTTAYAEPCEPAWHAIGGLNDRLFALTTWDPDGAGPASTMVVAGGVFTEAGGQPANFIAAWDPVTGEWKALGGGLSATVAALSTLAHGALVVGGGFTRAGGTVVNGVARWDGEEWHALGGGMTGFMPPARARVVMSLDTTPAGDLLATGSFTHADGEVVNGIARWDGDGWRPIGAGTGGVTWTAQRFGSGLLAGVLDGVSRWDGALWTLLGGRFTPWGTDGASGATDLAVLPSGDLVAVGYFIDAGGTPGTRGIARWDGSAWRSVGGGVSGSVFGGVLALAKSLVVLPSGDLIAGGTFEMAGTTPAINIARWDGVTWNALGSGLGPDTFYEVVAMTVLPNGDLVVGGSFLTAGGESSPYIALWRDCPSCSADCDGSGGLDFLDFLCFQNRFGAGDPAADCDGSGGLDFFDFLCFQNAFAAGCP